MSGDVSRTLVPIPRRRCALRVSEELRADGAHYLRIAAVVTDDEGEKTVKSISLQMDEVEAVAAALAEVRS